jgi:WD40 repeat protein
MFCLSSPSITEHAEYKNWTPISGRLKCFDKLRSYLELIYPINKEERKIVPGIFQRVLKTLIVSKFLLDSNEQIQNVDLNTNINMTFFDDNFLKDSEKPEYEFVIENDLKLFKKIPKDDIELLKSNNAIKAIRNEKISQSLQVNKISEIEEDMSPDKKEEEVKYNNTTNLNNLPQSSMTTHYKNFSNEINNINISQEFIANLNSNLTNKTKDNNKKNILHEIKEEEKNIKSSPVKNFSKLYNKSHSPNYEEYQEEIRDVVDDEIVEVSNDRLRKNNQGNNFSYNNYGNPKNEKGNKSANLKDKSVSVSKSKHDLSDLDKEEYYMKSCYEFYDYDICTLTERKVITDTHPIRTSCFSPQGDYFSVGTNSKSVKIFYIKPALEKFNKKNSYNFKSHAKTSKSTTLEDIKLVFEQKNHHMGSIYCLDWSVSGRLIASGSNDKIVKLMVIPDLEESYMLKDQDTLELAITGHKGTVRTVSFEPTSDLILLSAGTVDNCIKVWDAEKGTNITNLEGHSGDVHTIKWSNDALICGTSGIDKTIRFWDLRDYKSTSLISALKYTDINDISIYTKNKSVINLIFKNSE